VERKEVAMIYLDTHVVVWLYAGLVDKLSQLAVDYIETNDIVISPMVQLELTYLQEAKKITSSSKTIIDELSSRIGLKVGRVHFEEVVMKAEKLTWTRDPFDRLITAEAMCASAKLITKDKVIRKHYKLAAWDGVLVNTPSQK
jgi:PIN domain nuclease of toxin-antitoxin system